MTPTVLDLGLMPALDLAFGRTRSRPEEEEVVGRLDGDWFARHAPAAMASLPFHTDPGV